MQEYRATFGENGEITHFLDNSYREYKLEPKEVNEIIEKSSTSPSSPYHSPSSTSQ